MNTRKVALAVPPQVAIDEWSTNDQLGNDTETDFRIAAAVARLLDQAEGQFIVIFKRGNHPPHSQNYPASHSTWTPDDFHFSEGDSENDIWVNTYDNAIRYNLDRFFQILLGTPQSLDRAVILYTSDHGQLLTDARTRPAPSVEWGEVAVPLWLLSATPPPVDVAYRASQANIMMTLLDLMQVPRDERPFAYARSLLSARGTHHDPRRVSAGSFFGFGKFVVQDFDQLARDPGD